MDKAKRARKAETPRQPSLGLRLRAPYLYPDRAAAGNRRRLRFRFYVRRDCDGASDGHRSVCCGRSVHYVLSRRHSSNASQRGSVWASFCVVQSSIAASFFLLPPRWSFWVERPADVADLVLFILRLEALFYVILITGLRSTLEGYRVLSLRSGTAR
jgi:hypothetical protein